MLRRGVFRKAAAIAAAAGAAKSGLTQGPLFQGPAPGVAVAVQGAAYARGGMVGAMVSAPSAGEMALMAAREALFAQREREQRVTALLGGYPPSVASMRSWAPWFRAQRAVAITAKREAGLAAAFTEIAQRADAMFREGHAEQISGPMTEQR